jgi:primosomal protein N'
VGWQVLQRRARTCTVCGFRSIGLEQCPACGAVYDLRGDGVGSDAVVDASQATIDVEVIEESD